MPGKAKPTLICSKYVDGRQRTKQVQISRFRGSNPEADAKAFLIAWRDDPSAVVAAWAPDAAVAAGVEVAPGAAGDPMVPVELPIARLSSVLDLPDLGETGATVCLFGSSKSGKTHSLIAELAADERLIDPDNIVILLSESAHASVYAGLPARVIRLGYFDPKLIPLLQTIQRRTKNKYRFVLILDDIVDERDDRGLKKAFLTLRNSKISTIMLLQSCTLLSKQARLNVNGALFHAMNNAEAIDQVMTMFLGSFPPFYGLSRDAQQRLYRNLTEGYYRLYLDCLNGKLYRVLPA